MALRAVALLVLLFVTILGKPLHVLENSLFDLDESERDDIGIKQQKDIQLWLLKPDHENKFFIQDAGIGTVTEQYLSRTINEKLKPIKKAGQKRSPRSNNVWDLVVKVHEERLQLSSPTIEDVEKSTTPITEESEVKDVTLSQENDAKDSKGNSNTTGENFLPGRLHPNGYQRPNINDAVRQNNTRIPEERKVLDKLLLKELQTMLTQCPRSGTQAREIPESFLVELQKLLEKYSVILSNGEQCGRQSVLVEPRVPEKMLKGART